jgi:hypothetical protein
MVGYCRRLHAQLVLNVSGDHTLRMRSQEVINDAQTRLRPESAENIGKPDEVDYFSFRRQCEGLS